MQDEGYELEARMLTNIEAAVGYISNEWDLGQPKKETNAEEIEAPLDVDDDN
jgi:hypothetical protein